LQDDDPIFPSLLARSAAMRLGFAVVLIGGTWLAIQWAVALP